MRQLPVRLRLTLAFAVAMAAVLAAVGLFVYHRVGNELLASVDQTLLAQAQEGARTGHVDADTAGGTTLAEFAGPDATIRDSDPPGLPALLDHADLARATLGGRVWREVSIAGRRGRWRVLALPAPRNGGVAIVARSLEPRAESLDHLRHELVLVLPLALLAASLGGYLLAAGALRPVEAMRRRAARVTAAEPGLLPVPPARDELARLAVTLNDMLARLHDSFEHERRFVSDASHELRTPLALLRAELELALRRPRSREELEDAVRSAAEETERLSRLAQDLLLIARADQAPLPLRRERVPAEELLATVAARFAAHAGSLGRELHVAPSDLVVDADPGRVEQALGNLVANALAHGAGAVSLAAEGADGTVELHVRDEGPGLAPEFLGRAFDRFSRADESRGRSDSSPGGAGLGLSIVETVARAHGGSAGLRNRPGGGADAWIALPRDQRSGASTAGDRGRRRTGEVAAGGAARPGRVDAPTEDHAEMRRG
ncbi:MAG TPA: HAMP domain-containing sensor histidine kinase [Gaiellaceae bacterium]|nr:HAMP domain-containing sensor histidine kinase [Gaiellaceae bacterium]